MRVLLIGPPGAGKGTQAARIAEEWSIPHISTGNLLREAITAETTLGLKWKPVVDSGGYVPDDVMIELIRGALSDNKDFLLDGFPRTIGQADALDAILADLGRVLQAVVHLYVPDDILIERFTGRRTCPVCQRAYHVKANPPRLDGVCDDDGAELIIREDDAPDAVRRRVAIYHDQTDALVDRYEAAGILATVDGVQPIDAVGDRIHQVLKRVDE